MIKLEKVYSRDKSRRNLYYTILDENIYFQNHDEETTSVVGKQKIKILEKSCATHNFTPFKYGNSYLALGGQDSWKHDSKWRDIDYEKFKDTFEDHFKKPFTRDKKFYGEIKYKFDTTPVWTHNKGLYLFESLYGIGWTEVSSEPVLTVNSAGYISALDWKSTEFDGRPSIVKRKDKYYIYLRANVDKGIRRIQYTTTKDFKEFAEFRLIKTDNEDNEYLISTFRYGNKIYGFIPAYNDKESYINLYSSKDGENFTLIDRYFHDLPFYVDEKKPKNKCHSCEGIVEKDNDIFFYIHHNYLGYDKSHNVCVVEYSISKRHL